MRELVIGAGIGGLTPAQGLRRAGIEVTVRPATSAAAAWSSCSRLVDPFRKPFARTDPDAVGCFPFRTADPDADPAPWRTGPVTALGDVVHAMPPTGGRGAATAMRDADSLVDHLTAAAAGVVTVPAALYTYEREMATGGRTPSGSRCVRRPGSAG